MSNTGAISDPFADLEEDTRGHSDDSARQEGGGMRNVDLYSGQNKGPNIFPEKLGQGAVEVKEPLPKAGGLFEVTVSDPEKKGEGMYAYVSYKVNTKMETSVGKYSQSSVVRRYSDFVWLHTALQEKYAGYLIPPLPEKAIMGRFSPMFVDSRMRGLEVFVNRVARHAELCKSEELKLFLHGGQEFHDIREGKDAAQNKKKTGKGFMDMISDLSSSVTTSLSGSKEREKSREDVLCENIDTYADGLEASVTGVHANIVLLTKRTKDVAHRWFELGLSFTLLAQYEANNEEQQLGNAFAKLGTCADRISVLLTQKVDSQIVYFEEPFEDFIRTVRAVKVMLKARHAALGQYHNALSGLDSKNATLQKYQGKPGKEAKVTAAEKEVMEAQKVVDDQLAELQRVTDRVLAETARFKQEKRHNFKNVMRDFVRMQIETSKKIQASWESLLPDIESLPFDTE